MKKLVSILVLVFLVVSSAAAEDIDLSGLSFDQLVQLQSRITMEIMQRDEWQEVTVPAGIYLVGRDIPAGKWNIKSSDPKYSFMMTWSKTLGADKNSLERDDVYNYHAVHNGDTYALELTDGFYLMIDGAVPVIFSPFTGHSLGFK